MAKLNLAGVPRVHMRRTPNDPIRAYDNGTMCKPRGSLTSRGQLRRFKMTSDVASVTCDACKRMLRAMMTTGIEVVR